MTRPSEPSTAEDGAFDRAIEYARELGTEHGRNAAGWYAQDAYGSRSVGRWDGDALSARHILLGIADGDPEILETFPSADLSGQWADTLTGPQLVSDAWDAAGIGEDAYDALAAEDADGFTEICDAYEDAFADAVTAEIERTARIASEDADGETVELVTADGRLTADGAAYLLGEPSTADEQRAAEDAADAYAAGWDDSETGVQS